MSDKGQERWRRVHNASSGRECDNSCGKDKDIQVSKYIRYNL